MHDVIIIGAGPAGLTAGLYAGRSRLDTLILEKMSIGGTILLSESIENFPGVIGPVSTQELMGRMEEQVRGVGVKIESTEVMEIDCRNKTIKTADNNTYSAHTIIVATGARPRKLNVPGEKEFTGKGVSYCATCDGPLYKNKNVVVVGGGNAAAEEAIYLSRFASSVSLVHRRDQLRASGIIQEKLRANNKIKLLLSRVVTQINGGSRVDSVKLKDVNTEKQELMACDGVFIYVGYDPETGFLKNQLRLDEAGFIITAQDMAASEAGVFACGDCRQKTLFQVITACSDGAIAAESAYKYIAGKK